MTSNHTSLPDIMTKMLRFIDAAAGEGIELDGVDAGELALEAYEALGIDVLSVDNPIALLTPERFRTFSPDRPSPPVSGESVKPMAWYCEKSYGKADGEYSKWGRELTLFEIKPEPGYRNITPLYASPPDQSSLIKVLTEALEEISDMLLARPDIVAKLHPLMGFAEKAIFDRARSALALAKEAK